MKQTRHILLMVAILLCSLALSAQTKVEIDGIWYNLDEGTQQAEVTSGSTKYTFSITIPATVTHEGVQYNVTSIGEYAFYNCWSLTAITLPEGVTSIGDLAFRGCSSLTAINIPEGVTSIGIYTFSDCSSLTSITLPEGVTSIGYDAFYYCSNLYKVINYSKLSLSAGSSSNGYVAYYAKVVYQGGELTTVGDFQFYTSDGIHSLVNYIGNDTEIGLPDSYNGENYEIGDYAFRGCSSLTAITLPEGVTSIGNCAFDNCTALKKVIIEDGSSTLSLGYNNYYSSGTGQGLFYDCPLEEVYLGRNLSYNSGSSYGYSPFYNKDALINVVIGNEVTQIRELAFYSCDNIHSLTIPSGVLSIGYSAFSTPEKVIWLTNTPPTGYTNAQGSINYAANDQHSSLSNLRVYPYLSSIFEVEGVKYVPVSPSERTCHAIDCAYNSTAMVINVGETAIYKRVEMKVMEVMPYTFYGNDHIKEVSVSHLGNLGDYAFCDCDAIETVDVLNQGGIGKQSFLDCDGIKSVEIRNQGSIGSEAFYGCNAMETAIVANEGAVGDQAFSGCSSLKTVTLGDGIGSLGYQAFYQCSSLQEIVIPDSVKSVGQYCFSGCTAMKGATIGDGVPNIAQYTFQSCTGLINVVVGDGVTTINNYAFTGCSALTNVTLGRSVATINDYAFRNCSSLPEITLPQAVTKVGDYVFVGCSKLADVVIADRTTALNLGSNGSSPLFASCPLDSVYIGGKITYSTSSNYGYSPFYRNTSLRSVVITDREEQIYENEFYGCTNLQNVTIGNGVKSIGNYAFSGCSSLAGFSFGSSMETIGEEAFSDCTSLTSITSHAAVPPTCGTQALDDINKWECVLSVPLGNADAYYAADQWKEFFFIEDVVEVDHYVLTYVVDGEVVHTEVLKHKDPVTMLAEPTKVGYEFSGWDKTITTMPAEDVTISGTFTRVNVTHITITVNQYGSGTYCSVYALDFSNVKGLKAYAATGYKTSTGVVTLTRVMTTQPGEGIFIKGEPGEYKVPVMESTDENTLNMLVGTLTKTSVNAKSDDGLYANYKYTIKAGEAEPKFYQFTDGSTLSAGKAYLQIPMAWLPAEAKSISLRFEEGEGTTDIENSQFTIDNSQLTYDLFGRRVDNPVKGGIYIVGGRKVVL